MDEKELEILILSKSVREYILETGWKFTDFQRATLLCHREGWERAFRHSGKMMTDAAFMC